MHVHTHTYIRGARLRPKQLGSGTDQGTENPWESSKHSSHFQALTIVLSCESALKFEVEGCLIAGLGLGIVRRQGLGPATIKTTDDQLCTT